MSMKRRIRRHADVENDIHDIALYIARDNMPAALRFFDAAETTLKWLLSHPGAAVLRDFDDPALSGVRSWAVKGYKNHLIFYEIEDGGIYVLAIVHAARDLPRVLRGRFE